MLRFGLVLGALASAMLPAVALAQAGGVEWSEIDCAQSRLFPTHGLRCRTTAAEPGKEPAKNDGPFRFWNATGTVQNTKYYYYAAEAVIPAASVVSPLDLADALRSRSPHARGSTGMSEVHHRQDADFVSFKSAANEACIGLRKIGPGNVAGTRWVLYATRCGPPGHALTEADIDGFIKEARLKE
jgi:hypothetical protein